MALCLLLNPTSAKAAIYSCKSSFITPAMRESLRALWKPKSDADFIADFHHFERNLKSAERLDIDPSFSDEGTLQLLFELRHNLLPSNAIEIKSRVAITVRTLRVIDTWWPIRPGLIPTGISLNLREMCAEVILLAAKLAPISTMKQAQKISLHGFFVDFAVKHLGDTGRPDKRDIKDFHFATAMNSELDRIFKIAP